MAAVGSNSTPTGQNREYSAPLLTSHTANSQNSSSALGLASHRQRALDSQLEDVPLFDRKKSPYFTEPPEIKEPPRQSGQYFLKACVVFGLGLLVYGIYSFDALVSNCDKANEGKNPHLLNCHNFNYTNNQVCYPAFNSSSSALPTCFHNTFDPAQTVLSVIEMFGGGLVSAVSGYKLCLSRCDPSK